MNRATGPTGLSPQRPPRAPARRQLIRGLIVVTGLALALILSVVALAKSRPRISCPGTCWIPSTKTPQPWQWELDHPLRLTSAADMGTNSKTFTGKRAHPPSIYDIDGIDNSASTVLALHRRHDHAICYIEAGAAGDYPDGAYPTYYAEFKRAGVVGAAVQGYPERYVNINSPKTVAIVKAIIRNQCAAKHFDAVEPDIDDSWYDSTGFTITMKDEEVYLGKLSAYAHSLGLSWGLKDGDQANSLPESATFIRYLVAHHIVNWGLTEQSFQYGTVSAIYPVFARAHLTVFEAEYSDQNSPANYCVLANKLNINAVLYDENLDGLERVTCR